jgi:hypothetical protein
MHHNGRNHMATQIEEVTFFLRELELTVISIWTEIKGVYQK